MVASKKRVTRLVYGAFVVFVGAFVVSMIAQVGQALFGAAQGPAASPKVGRECATGLTAALGDIDASIMQELVAAEANGTLGKRPAELFEETRPRYPEVERICRSDPNGAEALAALARYERAARSAARRQAVELSPVRAGAASFISGAQ